MTWVCGIDFSSNAIDLVAIDLDDKRTPIWTRYQLNGQDAFDRTRQIGMLMPSRGSRFWDDFLAVGIEHPAGKFGVGAMMRVQGAVLSQIPAGLLVKPWPPGAWKKAVGLSGSATKERVREFSLANHRHEHGAPLRPFDYHDAFCIALATRQAIDRKAAA